MSILRALFLTLLFAISVTEVDASPPRRTSDAPTEWLDVGMGQSFIY